ncbi:MAG: hypothetical protein MUE33_10715 [Cytophagaceae bacterium]|jgi:hypothetical protein|nr:hypothetical protein [Cytophagaceae bacterium]
MNFKQLNKDLEKLILKKNELNRLTYDDKNYDDVEEELHDLEDDFLDNFGDELEKVLNKVHEKIAADSDVLLPIAYIGSYYKQGDKLPSGGLELAIMPDQGVIIESEKFPGKNTRLIFGVHPVRLIITQQEKQTIVWEEGQ